MIKQYTETFPHNKYKITLRKSGRSQIYQKVFRWHHTSQKRFSYMTISHMVVEAICQTNDMSTCKVLIHTQLFAEEMVYIIKLALPNLYVYSGLEDINLHHIYWLVQLCKRAKFNNYQPTNSTWRCHLYMASTNIINNYDLLILCNIIVYRLNKIWKLGKMWTTDEITVSEKQI